VAATIRIKGFAELRAKLGDRMIAGPTRRFLNRWSLIVLHRARQLAPINRGRLRGSITNELAPDYVPLWARVGTNLPYGRYMEHGTGLLNDQGGGSRHWPPGEALNPWARQHGFTGPNPGYAVARAIGLRGGLRPRRYLRGAVEESVPHVPSLLEMMARDIERTAPQ
jgi:hypothetical protein